MNKFKREVLDKTFQSFMEVGLSGKNLDLINDMVAKDASLFEFYQFLQNDVPFLTQELDGYCFVRIPTSN